MRPSAFHTLTRTMRSPSTRSCTIRSSAPSAAGSPESTPLRNAGSTMLWPVSTANCRASRIASVRPRLRKTSSDPTRNSASTTSPVSANWTTARVVEGTPDRSMARFLPLRESAYDQCPIVPATGARADLAHGCHESRGAEHEEGNCSECGGTVRPDDRGRSRARRSSQGRRHHPSRQLHRARPTGSSS